MFLYREWDNGDPYLRNRKSFIKFRNNNKYIPEKLQNDAENPRIDCLGCLLIDRAVYFARIHDDPVRGQ